MVVLLPPLVTRGSELPFSYNILHPTILQLTETIYIPEDLGNVHIVLCNLDYCGKTNEKLE